MCTLALHTAALSRTQRGRHAFIWFSALLMCRDITARRTQVFGAWSSSEPVTELSSALPAAKKPKASMTWCGRNRGSRLGCCSCACLHPSFIRLPGWVEGESFFIKPVLETHPGLQWGFVMCHACSAEMSQYSSEYWEIVSHTLSLLWVGLHCCSVRNVSCLSDRICLFFFCTIVSRCYLFGLIINLLYEITLMTGTTVELDDFVPWPQGGAVKHHQPPHSAHSAS